MIDPLEVVLNLAKTTTALASATGGRIDDRHHYGQDTNDWAQNATGLTITPIGGIPIIDLPVSRFQMDARCYGDTFYEAGTVFRELVQMTPAHRRLVTVTEGVALVYYVVVVGQLRRILDEEVRPNGGMPCYLVQLQAEIANDVVQDPED